MASDGISIDGLSMKSVYDKTEPKITYTSRDYNSIFEDLVNSIPNVSEKWTSRDESDPGIVLIKLMSMYGDMLSYNMDKQVLECFPNSVTQRKNAAQIFSLVGYKMNWYRSAKCYINLVNTYAESATIQRFSKFQTADGSITYTNPFRQIEVLSNTTNNGLEVEEELLQGVPLTPPLKTGAKVPEENKPWHDIYSPNIEADDILGNKIYLKDANVDQTSITLIDNFNDEWTLVDNVNLQINSGKFFELRIDEYDKPYLYLVNYWRNMNILNFKLFYVISKGKDGQINDNALKKLDSQVYALIDMTSSRVINIANYIKFTNYASTYGYDPETPDEARENASAYINTLDTLVTLDDFTRFGMRQRGVANCIATDSTTDPGIIEQCHYGNIKGYGDIDRYDLTLIQQYIRDPETYPLTSTQLKLADLNNDGIIDSLDEQCMIDFLAGKLESAGRCGNPVTISEPLPDLTVKLYIVRTPEQEALGDSENYKNEILTALNPYKLMPLKVIVDLESIKIYYWTIKGKVYLKKPVKLDVAQDLLVAINNQLQFDFGVDKIPFNTEVRYMDVVHSIEDKADPSLVDQVVLDPIVYTTDDGEEVTINDITGENVYEFSLNTTSDPDEVLRYKTTLQKTPVKPNTLVLNINDGEYMLKDNGDGKISNKDGVLQTSGTINYVTGEFEVKFSSPQIVAPKIKYKQNIITSVRYANLNTQDFEIADESLLSE